MAELVTLDRFGAEARGWHVYRIRSSTLDHREHYHDYFQVCCVTRGSIVHRQEGREVRLRPGDAFVIPPGFVHSVHFDERSEMYSLSFAPSSPGMETARPSLNRFLDELGGGAPSPARLRVSLDGNRRESMTALMECLIRQQKAECPPELSAAPELLTAALYLLAQAYSGLQGAAERTPERSAVAACVRYVNEHCCENLRAEELARCFGLSRSALCTAFPQLTGLPLHRYLAQKRIARAKWLIRARSEQPLGLIGQEIGYEDPSTFYRNFLRITGMSPAEYRALTEEARGDRDF